MVIVCIPIHSIMNTMRLCVELVPKTCWYSNVRSLLSKSQWDTIKKMVFAEAGYVCEICGGKGPKHPVECHEIWGYDDLLFIQKLNGMIALCPKCHRVKHFGLACIQGREAQVTSHLKIVNGISTKEAENHIKQSFKEFDRRSKHQWALDVSYLEKYGIDISELKL